MHIIRRLALAVLLPASAVTLAQTSTTEQQARELVSAMENAQRPAREVVLTLMELGYTAEEATALTVEVADDPRYRSYGTLAGMCIALFRQESPMRVGQAAIDSAGTSPEGRKPVVDTVSVFTPADCNAFNPKRRPAGLYFEGGPGVLTPSVDPDPDSPAN